MASTAQSPPSPLTLTLTPPQGDLTAAEKEELAKLEASGAKVVYMSTFTEEGVSEVKSVAWYVHACMRKCPYGPAPRENDD